MIESKGNIKATVSSLSFVIHFQLRAMPRFSSDHQKIISLQYIADLECFKTEKPYRINDIELDPSDNIQLTNIEFETRDVTLLNLRSQQKQLDFDECGFKYIHFSARTTPGFEDESIIAYSNEAIELLNQHVKADTIICYDLRVCKARLDS